MFNEIFPSHDREQTGFIELYNVDPIPVKLFCWSIDTGSDVEIVPYYFPVDTQVDPGKFLVIEKIVPIFPISKSGSLRLLDGFGEVVNEITYAIAEDATGRARIPDGTGDWVDVSTRTKGTSNETPTPTPRPVRRTSSDSNSTGNATQGADSQGPTRPVPRFLRITEIYYDGQIPRTEGDEFIEIQNHDNKVAYLVRVRILTQSATARSPVTYGFPSGTKLSPEEIIVIAKNALQFTARFGEQPDFEARASGAGYSNTTEVPNLVHDRRVSRRTWALANSGATVALMSDTGDVIDVVAYAYDPDGYLGLRGLVSVSFQAVSHSGAGTLAMGHSPSWLRQPCVKTCRHRAPCRHLLLLHRSRCHRHYPSPAQQPRRFHRLPPSRQRRRLSPPLCHPLRQRLRPPPYHRLPFRASRRRLLAHASPTPPPTATPTPPPPTPTPTILQCLTDIPHPQSPQRVVIVGIVTEIRPLPNETLVFIADNCGGAILHLAIDVSTPPTGSRIRLTVSAYSSDTRTDLYLAPGTSIEYLSGTVPPQVIPFMQALIDRAQTGTLVRSRGTISKTSDFTGKPIYETLASFIRLDPHTRAVPLGPVVLYGILEWRDAAPLLRVHYVAPARTYESRLANALRDWNVPRLAKQHARDVINFLLVKSLTRGKSLSLP